MNWIDIVVLIPAAWFAYRGLKNGLIYELASIIALILGVWVTVRFSPGVAMRLGDGKLYQILAFVIIFVATLVLVHFAGKLMEKVIKLLVPGIVNNIVGLIFGVFKVLIVFSVIFMFINKVDTKEVLIKPETKTESLTYKYITPVAPFLSDWCKKEWDVKSDVISDITNDKNHSECQTTNKH